MSAPTTVNTTPNSSATRPERVSPADRVWETANAAVSTRRAQAATERPDASFTENLQLAYAHQLDHLRGIDDDTLADMSTAQITGERVALLALETPTAASLTDRAKAGFTSRTERDSTIIQLAQYNRHLADALSHMPQSMLPGFATEFVAQTAQMTGNEGIRVLTPQEFEGIMRGMTREVAFTRLMTFNAPEEWRTQASTPHQDAKGWDIEVRRDRTRVVIDLKTNGAFEHIVDSTIGSENERKSIKARGYILSEGKYIVNADYLGTITGYDYGPDDTDDALAFVENLLDRQAAADLRKLGKPGIVRSA